jgi:hypothetical protein
MLRLLPALLGVPLLLASCASAVAIEMEPEDGLTFLAQCLTGTFDSVSQAEADPDEYFPVRMHAFPIWSERADGPWLYVEQALLTTPERPYRQRVYRLATTEQGYRIEVYELPEPALSFAGLPAAEFPPLTPEELALRSGCALDLELIALGGRPAFAGSTAERACPTNRSGATYATSVVTLTSKVLETWDRGFADGGEQVWGAVPGPYRFVRVPGTFPIPGH